MFSNFAWTPFTLDNYAYQSVEGFWQSLKTIDPKERQFIAQQHGFAAKQAGRNIANQRSYASQLLVYEGKLYRVASEAHHRLLERALRAKTAQNPKVREALLASGTRPLKHMLANRFGQLRPGDSPALPAITFEKMLTNIRTELQEGRFIENLPIPEGI